MQPPPDDEHAILHAGRWTSGYTPDRPEPSPDLEPDLEPIELESPDEAEAPTEDPRRTRRIRAVALATVIALIAAAIGFVGTLLVLDARDTPLANPVTDGEILDNLIVQPRDVAPPNQVFDLRDGRDPVNTPTLDLCYGDYATEGSRIARRQVAVAGLDGFSNLSTEAVTYRNVATSERAFQEVKDVVAACPKTPVTNAGGTSTQTTRFNPPPDGPWPRVKGVDRLAYDITTIDENNTASRTIVVYLRRGRYLMGIYFPQPAGPPTVDGVAGVSGIVDVFAKRLAELPPKIVGNPPD
jgi:hypothetical protein